MSEEITFDTIYNNANDSDGNSDVFGCCSRYRECSASGKCIHADEKWAQGCQYKINLEAGRIFYGKKAETFDQEKYDSLVSYYNGISETEKQVFEEIIFCICVKKRGVRRFLFLFDPTLYKVLAGCELFEIYQPSKLISILSERQILMLKSSEKFHDRYSSIPAPDFSDIVPPESITDEDDRRKYIATRKLKRWVQYFMHTDTELHAEFSRRFFCFEISDVMVFNEFFEDFCSAISGTNNHLRAFEPDNLNTFKRALAT